MKYLLILIVLCFTACIFSTREGTVRAIENNSSEANGCVYTLSNDGRIRDTCGKFQIGDTIHFTK